MLSAISHILELRNKSSIKVVNITGKRVRYVFLPVNVIGRRGKLDLPFVWYQLVANTGTGRVVWTFARRFVIIIYFPSSLHRYQCDECNTKRLLQGRRTLLVHLILKTNLFLCIVFNSINLTNKVSYNLTALNLQHKIHISTQNNNSTDLRYHANYCFYFTKSMEQKPSWIANSHTTIKKLLYSQQPATGPYSQPHVFSPHLLVLFLSDPF
jgi:hypothetical protein